jgi:hypothetical protein
MYLKLLNAATTVAAGTGQHITGGRPPTHGFNPSIHTCHVKITGSPTAVSVALNGSVEDADYGQLATHTFTAGELTAGYVEFHVTSKPVEWVQGEVLTLTGGTSPTVTFKHFAGLI